MVAKRIIIKNGVVSGFADEVSFEGVQLLDYQKKRVSRIVPVSLTLRLAFYFIRTIFSDESFMAAWTRGWQCSWLVLIDKEKYGPFKSRGKAIQFEKQKIYAQGKLS